MILKENVSNMPIYKVHGKQSYVKGWKKNIYSEKQTIVEFS